MNRAVWLGITLLAAISGPATASAISGESVLSELNQARGNPAEYAQKLRHYRQQFQGRVARTPNGGVGVMTLEGTSAVDEAIDVLERQAPVAALKHSDVLYESAAEQVNDQERTGLVGHRGSDGSLPAGRIQRHGVWRGSAAEMISYGQGTAVEVVLQLIVDDGVTDRAHRHTVFNPVLRVAGVACGPHPSYRTSCVIDLAGTMAPLSTAR